MRTPRLLFGTILAASCATSRSPASDTSAAPAPVRAIALPGAPPTGGVLMDYLAYDRAHHRVWVPAGNTGRVAVLDVASGQLSTVDGFPTAEVERNGTKRSVGPSSATVGEGYVFVGNRGDQTVCAIEADALVKAGCVTLESMPDGLAYVASTREVWATTPRDRSIVVIDAATPAHPAIKARIALEGEPEGFAVDDAHGVFYTNLEDKDRTLAIDIQRRQIAATWNPGCGDGGPKGLALDRQRGFLFVACTDRVKALDAGHGGKELAAIEAGAGIDNIEYLEARGWLYVGAARAGKLTIASIGASGAFERTAVLQTANGARNPVVAEDGTAYLTDSPEGKLLIVSPPAL